MRLITAIALGARSSGVLWLVLRDALLMVLVGAVAGILAAQAVSKFTESVLFGVTTADPLSFVIATVTLLGIAVFASLIPARRATKIDPMAALARTHHQHRVAHTLVMQVF